MMLPLECVEMFVGSRPVILLQVRYPSHEKVTASWGRKFQRNTYSIGRSGETGAGRDEVANQARDICTQYRIPKRVDKNEF